MASKEIWHKIIRGEKGLGVGSSFASEPEAVPGAEGVQINFLSIYNGDQSKSAVYVVTNVLPQTFADSESLRTLILDYIVNKLDQPKSPLHLSDSFECCGQEAILTSGISYRLLTASTGHLIIGVEPLNPWDIPLEEERGLVLN